MDQEKLNAITDVILAVVAGSFALLLFLKRVGISSPAADLCLFGWGAFFTALATAALIAAFDHAYASSTRYESILDRVGAICGATITVIAFFQGAFAFGGKTFAFRMSVIPVLLYLVFVVINLIRYRYVITSIYGTLCYAGAMVFYLMALANGVPTLFFIVGIVIFIAGLVIQPTRLRILWLNHNDLYHICIIVSSFFLVKGVFVLDRFFVMSGM